MGLAHEPLLLSAAGMDAASTSATTIVIAALLAGLVGSMVASYLGVVAERGWAGSAEGRSECVCGRQLAGWENVPVLSWVALRGRARCCGSRIPARYVLTEAALGVLCAAAVLVGARWGVAGMAAGAGAGFAGGGTAVLAFSRSNARPAGHRSDA